MRVALVHYTSSPSKILDSVVRGLSMGIQKQGHDVIVVNARTETDRSLTSFNYIVVGVTAPSIWAKSIPNALCSFLKSAGILSGKRCYAFFCGGGLWKTRLLNSLMRSMESEGMFLKKSDILSNATEAEAVGSRLHIGKPIDER